MGTAGADGTVHSSFKGAGKWAGRSEGRERITAKTVMVDVDRNDAITYLLQINRQEGENLYLIFWSFILHNIIQFYLKREREIE